MLISCVFAASGFTAGSQGHSRASAISESSVLLSTPGPCRAPAPGEVSHIRIANCDCGFLMTQCLFLLVHAVQSPCLPFGQHTP